MRGFDWPSGVERVLDEDWTRAPVETLATRYDTVENHGWYSNLDPTVDEVKTTLRTGDVLVDYSGGTGIFIDRLLRARPDLPFGVVNVDSSPKFLRLSLEKFRDEPRVAFRLIRYLKEERRLQLLDEALPQPLLARGVDAIVSTNAVHLYRDLDDTLASWARALRPGGRVFVQSGNVRLPSTEGPAWILDDTVQALEREARRIVELDERYARHRAAVANDARMAAHDAYRRRVFLPPRPLGEYVRALEDAGLHVVSARHRPIEAQTTEWLEFLGVYHDAILGWVGGSEKVEGRAPNAADVEDRMELLREGMRRAFGGRGAFEAVWTYVSCVRR